MVINFKDTTAPNTPSTPNVEQDSPRSRLQALGLIGGETKQEQGTISKAFSEEWSKLKKTFTDTIPQIGKDVVTGIKEFGMDVRKIQTDRLDEAEWIVGRTLQAWGRNVERIQEFNKVVDETGGNVWDKLIHAGLSTVRAWGDILWEAFISALDTLATDEVEQATKEQLQRFANTEAWQAIGDAIREGGEAIEQFENTSPQAKRLSMALKTTGLAGLEVAGAWTVKRGVEKTGEALWDAAAGIQKTVEDIPGAVTQVWEKIQEAVPWAKEFIETRKQELAEFKEVKTKEQLDAAKGKIDEVARRISQGDDADLPAVVETLKKIDTTGKETYADLSAEIDTNLKNITKVQDAKLSQNAARFWPENTTETIETALWTKTTNYVDNAIDDIEKVIEETGDFGELNKKLFGKDITLGDAIAQYRGWQASVETLNDLARYYGAKFKDKAFKKNWDPKWSISAATYEANRSGIKNFTRKQFDSDDIKNLDTEYSQMIKTKNLLDDMHAKAKNLEKKLKDRGIGAKIVHGVFKITDTVTGGALRATRELFQESNLGNKVNNNLDIQGDISKQLEKFEKLDLEIEKLKGKWKVDEKWPGIKERLKTGDTEVKLTPKWVTPKQAAKEKGMKQKKFEQLEKTTQFKKKELKTSAIKELSNVNSKNVMWKSKKIWDMLGVKWKTKQISQIINKYIKQYWEKLKDKLWDMFDEIADKIWARSKFIDDNGKTVDNIWNLKKDILDFWFEFKWEDIVLYRWFGRTNEKWNYFTWDKDYALNFSDFWEDTIKKIKLNPSEIYKPDILPEAVDEISLTKAINEARMKWFKAVYVDEWWAGTPSVFFIEKR